MATQKQKRAFLNRPKIKLLPKKEKLRRFADFHRSLSQKSLKKKIPTLPKPRTTRGVRTLTTTKKTKGKKKAWWKELLGIGEEVAEFVLPFIASHQARGLPVLHKGCPLPKVGDGLSYNYGTVITSKGPKFASKNGGEVFVLAGEDFLCSVSTSATAAEHAQGTVLWEAEVNPYRMVGTRFSAFAPLFERFRIIEAAAQWRPTVGADTDGNLLSYFDYDADSTVPASGGEANIRMAGAHSGEESYPVWTPTLTVMKGAQTIGEPLEAFYCDYTRGDARLSSQGKFVVMAGTDLPDSTALGQYFVAYKVEFYLPQLDESQVGTSTNVQGKTDMTCGQPFGTEPYTDLSGPYDPVWHQIIGKNLTWKYSEYGFSVPIGWYLIAVNMNGIGMTGITWITSGDYHFVDDESGGDPISVAGSVIFASPATEIIGYAIFYSCGLDQHNDGACRPVVVGTSISSAQAHITKLFDAPRTSQEGAVNAKVEGQQRALEAICKRVGISPEELRAIERDTRTQYCPTPPQRFTSSPPNLNPIKELRKELGAVCEKTLVNKYRKRRLEETCDLCGEVLALCTCEECDDCHWRLQDCTCRVAAVDDREPCITKWQTEVDDEHCSASKCDCKRCTLSSRPNH